MSLSDSNALLAPTYSRFELQEVERKRLSHFGRVLFEKFEINSTAFGQGGFASFVTQCHSFLSGLLMIASLPPLIRIQVLLRSFADSLGRCIRCFSTCGSSVLTALSFLTRNTICSPQSACWVPSIHTSMTERRFSVNQGNSAGAFAWFCNVWEIDLPDRPAYYFMSHSRFSMFNLHWVSPVRQLLRTLSLMVQPRHWVVWLRRLDVGGYASLVRWIA